MVRKIMIFEMACRKFINQIGKKFGNNKGFTVTGAIIAGAAMVGAGAVASASIASSGAKSAAKAQAAAQQQAIAAQERAAEQERLERQTAIAKEETARQEAIERKETAIKGIKYPTYFESETAPFLRQTLEERLAGRGLVKPVETLDINRLTSPFAAQRRASLTKETIPLISSAASARGLGRSTLPVKQIGEASQAAERDIEQRVAELQIENKKIEEANIERERQQIESAIGKYQDLTGAQATSLQQRALFERGGEFDIAETIAGKAGAISQAEQSAAASYKANQFAIAESMEAKGATDAAYEMQQANIWASAISGFTQSAARSSEEIIDAIDKQQTSRSAQLVNISGMGRVPVAPADYYSRRIDLL